MRYFAKIVLKGGGFMQKYCIIVDMQNDFISGALGTKEAEAIVPTVCEKLANRRRDGWQILFTRDTHYANYLQTQEGAKLPVPHCIQGTAGWQIASALDTDDAFILDKPSFGTLALGEYLKAQSTDIAEIELVGLCTDICVLSNALILKAFFPETNISVDAACCAGVTPESHENALSAMKLCQVSVTNHG